MRSARAGDHWRNIYKKSFNFYLSNIQLNGLIGLQKIDLEKGLSVICGLNGAGKSTVLSAIKSVFGLPLTLSENRKISGKTINAIIQNKAESLICQNSQGAYALEQGVPLDSVSYIDYYTVTKALSYLTKQAANGIDFTEGIESVLFSNEELEDISCIIGKKYDSCTFYEVEEVVYEDEPDLFPATIPFFLVNSYEAEYSSLEMGIGEHFIFFAFWLLKRAKLDSLLIIEEPETFISIKAQVELMNYIAACCVGSGLSVVITTHSPYILERVTEDHIRVISRFGQNVSIEIPTNENPAGKYLGVPTLCNEGVIYVEDEVAKVFLMTIIGEEVPQLLDKYRVISASGEAGITQRLMFPKDKELKYKLIGIYDGDMLDKKESIMKKVEWPCLFLPLPTCFEAEFMNSLRNGEFFENFLRETGIKSERIRPVLMHIEGEDPHDWFNHLCAEIHFEYKVLIREFYFLWIEKPEVKANIEKFTNDLVGII